MKRLRQRVRLGVAGLSLVSCASADWVCPTAGDPGMRKVLPAVVAEATSIVPGKSRAFSVEEQQYFAFYDLSSSIGVHAFGTVAVEQREIAVHTYTQAPADGTVLLVHGYYDHAGVLAPLIDVLIRAGYNVVVYDQPGHGLSSGKRASIDSFSDYSKLFMRMVEFCRQDWQLQPPLHVVGHSLGAATILDAVVNKEFTAAGKVVLIAPLVRSRLWHLSGLGNWLASPFRDQVKRVFRNNSKDKAFRQFVKNDPLQPRIVPLDFVQAHRRWVKNLHPEPSRLPLVILQGKKDTVVDFDFNIKFLKKYFPKSTVVWYTEGGHQLMNEVRPLRLSVLTDIIQCLEAE